MCCHPSVRVKAALEQRSMPEQRCIRCIRRETYAPSGCGRRAARAFITPVCLLSFRAEKSRQNDKTPEMAPAEISSTTVK